MRAQIIGEEEAKAEKDEEEQKVVQDPGFFYAKQQQYKQNSKFYLNRFLNFFHKYFFRSYRSRNRSHSTESK